MGSIESKWGKVVVGTDDRGRKVLGKVVDFDAKAGAIIRAKRGPREDDGTQRVRVSARKAVVVDDGVPARLIGRKVK